MLNVIVRQHIVSSPRGHVGADFLVNLDKWISPDRLYYNLWRDWCDFPKKSLRVMEIQQEIIHVIKMYHDAGKLFFRG